MNPETDARLGHIEQDVAELKVAVGGWQETVADMKPAMAGMQGTRSALKSALPHCRTRRTFTSYAVGLRRLAVVCRRRWRYQPQR